MNFIFISSSDPNLLRKKSVKQKNKKTMALVYSEIPIDLFHFYFENEFGPALTGEI